MADPQTPRVRGMIQLEYLMQTSHLIANFVKPSAAHRRRGFPIASHRCCKHFLDLLAFLSETG